MRTTRALTGAAATLILVGCGGGDPAVSPGGEDKPKALEVTLVSDDSMATVAPVCVEDIPEDLATCPGAPGNIGKIELDQTRKATLRVPAEVGTSGYRIRVNGEPPEGLDRVLTDQAQPFQVSEQAVAVQGETVVTVEALNSYAHPKAVWRFSVSDPTGPPK